MTTHICSRCNVEKPINAFYKCTTNGKVKYRSECKICFREYVRPYFKKHYEKNKRKIIARAKAKKQEIQKFIQELKHNKICIDCGLPHPYWRMDYDHLHDKKFLIGVASNKGCCKETILNEIKKCDLICANCHRDRTYKRQQKMERREGI